MRASQNPPMRALPRARARRAPALALLLLCSLRPVAGFIYDSIALSFTGGAQGALTLSEGAMYQSGAGPFGASGASLINWRAQAARRAQLVRGGHRRRQRRGHF